MSDREQDDDYEEIRGAMNLMRTKGRIVKIPRDRGHLLFEAETYRSSGQEMVSHYIVRWKGDDVLPTYWEEHNPLTIRCELDRADEFQVLRRDDVDLD